MLTELCQELRNWFDVKRIFGTFTIENGSIDVDLQEGQYFRIVGSVFNDGVYQNIPEVLSSLHDEVFTGAVWAMAVPPEVIALASDIQSWQEKYGEASQSPYMSESFGGYSYSKGSGASTAGGGDGSPTWKSAFASRINKWRKIRI